MTLHSYDLFVFDLDGTLIDTLEDLAASLNHALRARALQGVDLSDIRRFVGDGARRLVERAHGHLDDNTPLPATAEASVKETLALFLSHYGEHCVVRSQAFPGVRKTLEHLREAEKSLAVLTNKPLEPALRILEQLGLRDFFPRILGGDSLPEKKPHPGGLLSLCDHFSATVERTVLIGDTQVDIDTARNAGSGFLGVTFGFRPEQIASVGPHAQINSFRDLLGNG